MPGPGMEPGGVQERAGAGGSAGQPGAGGGPGPSGGGGGPGGPAGSYQRRGRGPAPGSGPGSALGGVDSHLESGGSGHSSVLTSPSGPGMQVGWLDPR